MIQLFRNTQSENKVYDPSSDDVLRRALMESIHILERAAESGHADAQYHLGKLLVTNGAGGIYGPDIYIGRKYLTMAARNGHSSAMYVLAVSYRKNPEPLYGVDVTESLHLHVHWLRAAAQAAHPKAVVDYVEMQTRNGNLSDRQRCANWLAAVFAVAGVSNPDLKAKATAGVGNFSNDMQISILRTLSNLDRSSLIPKLLEIGSNTPKFSR